MNQKKLPTKRKVTSKSSLPSKLENNKLLMLPIIFVVAILPLITRRYEYKIGLSTYNWFSTDEYFVDFFLYYKQQFFIITCVIMLVLLLFYLIRYKLIADFNSNLIPLMIYAVFALLSTIFSKYRYFGFTGIFEQFESVFVLLGYCIIVFYAFYFIRSSKSIDMIFKYLTISILILSLLGLTQISGHDFFSTTLGLKLIVPRILWDYLDTIRFTFEKNTVYLTFFNPNYVGVYVGLLLPIYISLTITNKNKKNRILYIITIIGLIICLIGSGSATGFIGIISSIFFILFFYRKYIFKKRWFTIFISVLAIIGLIGFLATNYKTMLKVLSPTTDEVTLTEISTTEDIQLTYRGNNIRVNYLFDSNGGLVLTIYDDNGKTIDYSMNSSGTFEINDSKFSGIKISPTFYNNAFFINITIDGVDWLFTKQEDGTFSYLNKFGRLDKITTADSAVFTGYEKFASGRGYIWSRTIPLLKSSLFLGSGADTFVLVYPQQDYVNLYNYGFGSQVLTKPHSLYLQMGVQTGVISLIAFIVFYSLYFIESIRIYINGTFNSDLEKYGVAILIGTVSFMVISIANDSSVTVSPVFWALIGMGITINHLIKSKTQTRNK